ncbi:hypothetical protein OG787_46885 [Streptomyces sp. NBC_00075]|uniref:hypothetical protein n=1 Tax=Streptomyces sp. NBC_00075 TaxID=2975641 RepID=UPI003252B03B
MSFLHEEYGTDAEIYRKPLGTEVIADCSDPLAHRILVACGFVEMTAVPQYVWHQLPECLADEEQRSRATRAVCLLRAEQFDAHVADDLVSETALAAVLAEIRQRHAEINTAAALDSPAVAAATSAACAEPTTLSPTAPDSAIRRRTR